MNIHKNMVVISLNNPDSITLNHDMSVFGSGSCERAMNPITEPKYSYRCITNFIPHRTGNGSAQKLKSPTVMYNIYYIYFPTILK